MGAVQKAFTWQELAVLLSGYNYAAIVLVDSRYLYPAAYRTTPAAPALASPPPALSAASPACNTPKRQRDDGHGGGVSTGTGVQDESEAPSRRRRRRPEVQGSVDRESEEAASVVVVGDPPLSSAFSKPAVPSPAVESQEEEGKDRRKDAEVRNRGAAAPAPHAVERGGGVSLSPQAIPPPRGMRKSLGSDFFCGEAERGASLSSPCLAGAAAAGAAVHPRRSPQPLSTASTVADGADGTGSTPFSTPVVASPPPLKPTALCAPVGAVNGTTASPLVGADAALTPADSAYCGHYILLVGWSEAERVFIARDPARPSSAGAPVDGSSDAHVYLALPPEALDRARRCHGTDEDVLVIDLARSRKGGVAAAPLAAAAAATALAASAASPAAAAAAASAMVGLFAMAAAAAAAAAGADASKFREWGWPDPAAWFGGSGSGAGPGAGAGAASGGDSVDGTPSKPDSVSVGGWGSQQGEAAESASKRLAGLLSLAASGWRFPTVGDAYRGPRAWGAGGTKAEQEREGGEEGEEGERWAVRMASAMEGLLEGGRRAAYTMEGFLQSRRRAAYTMEGLLEGGRRAAYSLRDSLADVADAPGGAGAEWCGAMAWDPSGTPASGAARAVSSPA